MAHLDIFDNSNLIIKFYDHKFYDQKLERMSLDNPLPPEAILE